MTNTMHALCRRWREKHHRRLTSRDAMTNPGARARLDGEIELLDHCIRELAEAIDTVAPTALNEASTAKLYRWSDRLVRIMDLMCQAQRYADQNNEDGLVAVGDELGGLATQDFLNDIYDLMKQLSNRKAGA